MVSKPKERTMSLEDRIAARERRGGRREARGAAGETSGGARERPAPGEPAPRPAMAAIAPKPKPAREPIALEDFLGGRVLAWLGGGAGVAGVAFPLTGAISRGWVGGGGPTGPAPALFRAPPLGRAPPPA